MPELPEVKHHAEKLSSLCKDLKLESIIIRQGPYMASEKSKYQSFRNSVLEYKPHLITNVKTKGKYMYFVLDGEQYHALGIHHGMEGSWCDDSTNKHIILELHFSIGKTVFFQDSRRFGTFSFLSKDELEEKLRELGPDVFDEIEDCEELKLLIRSTKRIQKKKLCEAIVDQSFISGIGNYLRADIMYQAKLNPVRLINSLLDVELDQLFSAIKSVVKKSYESKATTTGVYTSSIHYGSYEFLIYGKKESPLGSSIESFKDRQKRTVWWVPTHQK